MKCSDESSQANLQCETHTDTGTYTMDIYVYIEIENEKSEMMVDREVETRIHVIYGIYLAH